MGHSVVLVISPRQRGTNFTVVLFVCLSGTRSLKLRKRFERNFAQGRSSLPDTASGTWKITQGPEPKGGSVGMLASRRAGKRQIEAFHGNQNAMGNFLKM